MSPGEARRIILLDLSTDEDTVLVEPGFDAHYLESGHLIYGGRDGQVRAALFDPESSEIGEPVVVLDSVKIEPLFGSMVLTADSYGTVVYVKEAPRKKSSLNRRLAIMDRSGGPELVRTEEGDIGNASFSRDGGHIAFSRDGSAWVVEVLTGRTHELGIQGQLSYVWSPNSEELAVGDNTGEGTTITFWRPDGTEITYGLGDSIWAASWEPETQTVSDRRPLTHKTTESGRITWHEPATGGHLLVVLEPVPDEEEATDPPEARVITNGFEELKRLVGN